MPASTSYYRSAAGAAIAGVMLVVALVVLVGSSSSQIHGSRDLRDLTIEQSTRVSSPVEEDPRVGPMFGKLIQLAFDCVVELKRALRGQRLTPDYDAEDKVEFVDVMLKRLVKDAGVDELPQPRLGGARASFTMAAKKVQLLRHLVQEIPLVREVTSEHAERYAVIKFDIVQVSHSLDRIIAELQERNFDAVEPVHSAVGHLLKKIEGSKIDSSSPLLSPATWKDVAVKVGENVVGGAIQGDITSVVNGNSVVAVVAGEASTSSSPSSSSSSSSSESLQQFEFQGTMDAHGDLVGTLSPSEQRRR